ncbi:hypothetical protein [Microbulbifer sp. YPW1]|uniref:hypothetical protein n=1 Tax=Microbulbifer sp. YPW1 TaxID=2745199 RepID=UPI0015984587|nr:hypothetical protein [Microbulbifer sp. YPW1]QKX16962.1 hypothetical protein HUW35_08080 [Microbulbifer sp. YPW1]
MIVPEYWAEAKLRERINGSQVTIKRFGWSDESEAAAQAHADERAKEAMARAQCGEKVRRIDHKVAYNGAEGLPIREEIIEKHGDVVITRNTYGALCLNTPDVLFADIDLDTSPPGTLIRAVLIALLTGGAVAAYWYQSWWILLVFAILGMSLTAVISKFLHHLYVRIKGGAEERALGVIEDYANKHPQSHLRLYRTPMGFRVLAMHKTFEPGSEEATQLLHELNADPLYVRMCTNQHCFRARVSPKPWRIGMGRLGPRPGVWPIRSERMSARARWVKNYNKLADAFSACRFVRTLGSGSTIMKTREVQSLHDQMSRADANLKLA